MAGHRGPVGQPVRALLHAAAWDVFLRRAHMVQLRPQPARRAGIAALLAQTTWRLPQRDCRDGVDRCDARHPRLGAWLGYQFTYKYPEFVQRMVAMDIANENIFASKSKLVSADGHWHAPNITDLMDYQQNNIKAYQTKNDALVRGDDSPAPCAQCASNKAKAAWPYDQIVRAGSDEWHGLLAPGVEPDQWEHGATPDFPSNARILFIYGQCEYGTGPGTKMPTASCGGICGEGFTVNEDTKYTDKDTGDLIGCGDVDAHCQGHDCTGGSGQCAPLYAHFRAHTSCCARGGSRRARAQGAENGPEPCEPRTQFFHTQNWTNWVTSRPGSKVASVQSDHWIPSRAAAEANDLITGWLPKSTAIEKYTPAPQTPAAGPATYSCASPSTAITGSYTIAVDSTSCASCSCCAALAAVANISDFSILASVGVITVRSVSENLRTVLLHAARESGRM